MKKIITLSAITVLASSMYASSDVEMKLEKMDAQIQKLEKKLKKANKNIIELKKHDGQDDIKWDVDFRTSMDSISYTMADGTKYENDDLLTNRLMLGMGFNPNDNTIFKGKLSYNKAYGDTANHAQSNSAMGVGFANFDWVTNENATDNTVKVKEAYWLYMNDTFLGNQIPWTFSIGRRPSTDGLGINMRAGMQYNSPLSHTVNVEFDGMSSRFDLDKVTGVPGMYWKLCTGRGMTNALPRFNMSTPGADYTPDKSQSRDIDMAGFIFIPYDDGQYSIHTNWAKAQNMIGFTSQAMQKFGMAQMGYDPNSGTAQSGGMPTKYLNGSPTGDAQGNQLAVVNGYDPNDATGATYYQNNDSLIQGAMMANAPKFESFGDLNLFTAMFKADGIGDGVSDFLDDTRFFASWAQSTTLPAAGMNMLGSNEKQTGTSTWVGLNTPCLLTSNGRLGFEWNKGSKYWRSVTYAEDTMVGSKIAARGTAVEAYYFKPINNALSFNVRYTKIDYDYTGSNMFFGEDGTPMSIADAKAAAMAGQAAMPVEKASNLHASISYRF
jgi:hypothetical protein